MYDLREPFLKDVRTLTGCRPGAGSLSILAPYVLQCSFRFNANLATRVAGSDVQFARTSLDVCRDRQR
jgi:hypothetical protein